MLRDEKPIGLVGIYRQEVRPFTDKHIELLKNFAAQAVIAIENARLLKELRQRTDDLTEALEQQTATSEVLKVISSSPGELEPVFQAMLENATRICGAKFGNLLLYDGEAFRLAATFGVRPEFAELRRREPVIRTIAIDPLGRAAATNSCCTSPTSAPSGLMSKLPADRGARRRGRRADGDYRADAQGKRVRLARSLSTARRCGRSPTNRSNYCRISRRKPSSPLRTRGY